MATEVQNVFFCRYSDIDLEVMTFSELSVKLSQADNHDPFSAHRIGFYFILISTQDSYTHFVDFNSYTLREGSAIFVAKGQIHNFTKELDRSTGYCVIFSSFFLDKRFFLSDGVKLNRLFNYHIGSPIIHQSDMGADNFVDIVSHLYREYYFPNEFAKAEMLRTLLYAILLKAERIKEVQHVGDSKLRWLEIFGSFKDLLEKKYVDTRNSKAYASELFVSYKLLNDIVKAFTGKTVKSFIDSYVVIEIKRYLVSTTLSIGEISTLAGFDESANMIKFFKKYTNTTPLKFRQKG